MRILLTNDDGISAAGLAALETALSQTHEVWVCAPDSERSGTSHAVHLQGPMRVHKEGPRRFSCSGTPADCVFVALRGDFIPAIDVVLSGINHGPNLGTDMIYSGTCAAARQGALAGCKALAVSLNYPRPFAFEPGAAWIASRWEALVAACVPGHFVNINLPANPVFPLIGVPATPAVRRYIDKVVPFTDPNGELYCFVDGLLRDDEVPPDTDWGVVLRGQVALSLLPAQPVASTWPGGPL